MSALSANLTSYLIRYHFVLCCRGNDALTLLSSWFTISDVSVVPSEENPPPIRYVTEPFAGVQEM